METKPYVEVMGLAKCSSECNESNFPSTFIFINGKNLVLTFLKVLNNYKWNIILHF